MRKFIFIGSIGLLFLLFLVFYFFVPKKEYSYYEDGSLKYTLLYTRYKNEMLYKHYYNNGKLMREGKLVNKKYDGQIKEYYPDGKLYIDCYYYKGLLEGEFKEFDEEGNLKRTINYHKNMAEGNGFYYRNNGTMKALNKFYNDSLYFVRLYKYDNFNAIDSQEIVIPLIKLIGGKHVGDTLSVVIKVITEDIPYIRDSFYINYAISKKDINGQFGMPAHSEQFIKDSLIRQYIISTPKDGVYFYGWLEYHYPDGKKQDFQEFAIPIP